MEDRLNHIRNRLKQCKVYYSRYSPRSDMMYEIDEADDDLSWMIYEIERLREESRELRERLESSSGEV